MLAHSLPSNEGIESRPDDLVGEDFKILKMSYSDTDSKEDRTLLLAFGLVTKTGTDDCPKVFAKSMGLI